MCDLCSWIEKDGKIVYLTADDVFRTKRGKELQRWDPNPYDWYGHGAIRWYYHFKGGQEHECTNFSSPDNFPPALVEDIKKGKMFGFGISKDMRGMLLKPASAKYQKAEDATYAEYRKAEVAASAKYQKARGFPLVGYGKARGAAQAECRKILGAAQAEYHKAEDAAFAECRKARGAALAEIFSDPKNRKKAWR